MSESQTNVDSDLKDKSNLLNDADTVQDISEKVLTTEVTSVAQEEAKSGQKINVPQGEELYAKASMSFIRNMQFLNQLVNGKNGGNYKISRKGMNRVLNAILQLPMDGLPVALQGNEEKTAFLLGQRLIADRYIITHHHIVQERKRLQEEQKNANVTEEQTEQTASNEGDKNE